MRWKKKGLIYVANGAMPWAKSHAMIPTPQFIAPDVIRIYLTFCDTAGIGRIGYVDVDANEPKRILNISKEPVLDIGQPGTFDENGVLVTSVITLPEGKKYLYYVGFELGKKIRYRLLTGIAISTETDQFERLKKVPILERSDSELYFRCGPFVLFDENKFKMWYVAGSSWMVINNKELPVYTINYLESSDGIHWGEKGKICIDINRDDEHGLGRPYVIKENGLYKMFFSIRKKLLGYRLGYAESYDGINWQRKDDELNFDVSEEGWDSETICYTAVIQYQDKIYLFYNGNAFGQTGFGYALLDCA